MESCRQVCHPGYVSMSFVSLAGWVWFVTTLAPLVRTPLPYQPTLLPDNFTSLTTYTLLSAYSEYSPFDYVESGDVLKVESYEDKMRNSTFTYEHKQTFSGTTCNFHVHGVVTGYEWTGDVYKQQGDVYPVLQAQRCDALVTFRGMLIALILLPFLSCFLCIPSKSIAQATKEHVEYEKLFVVVADGNRRGEGQRPMPDEPPSPSHRQAPPSYNAPGYTIDMPDPPAAVVDAPPVAVGHVMFHNDPAHPPHPPGYQPPSPPRRRREPRRYLPQANVERAARLVQIEGAALRKALRQTWIALLPAALSVCLSVGALGALASFVSNERWVQPSEVQWGTWTAVASLGPYAVIVLMECAVLVVSARLAVRRYLLKEGASWRSLLW